MTWWKTDMEENRGEKRGNEERNHRNFRTGMPQESRSYLPARGRRQPQQSGQSMPVFCLLTLADLLVPLGLCSMVWNKHEALLVLHKHEWCFAVGFFLCFGGYFTLRNSQVLLKNFFFFSDDHKSGRDLWTYSFHPSPKVWILLISHRTSQDFAQHRFKSHT